MSDLSGKIVVVTGAKGGLGEVVTRAFLDAGAAVVGVTRNIRDADFPGGRFSGIAADLSSESSVGSMMDATVERFGRVDALVHLVGGWAGGKIDATGLATFDKMLTLNLRTSFLAIRAALKPMKIQGAGRILAIGSKVAVEPAPGSAAYAAAKAALVSLIRSVAAETRGSGITANIVLPGTMDTPANREAMPNSDYSKWVDPAQVAALLVHLASDDARDISGAVIPVLGGEG